MSTDIASIVISTLSAFQPCVEATRMQVFTTVTQHRWSSAHQALMPKHEAEAQHVHG